jgi:HEAT repeat protein
MSPLSPRLLTALCQGSEPLSADQVALLSDLSADDRRTFLASWPEVPRKRRLQLLEQMGRLAVERFELNFDAVDLAALSDPDPAVRSAAIRNLWENEDPSLAERLLRILNSDPEPEPVRAAAAALGHFVLIGELGQLEEAQLARIVSGLLSIPASSSDEIARRKSVESLGYSSQPEATVVIQEAFDAGTDEWRTAALVAMGRSANPDWAESVLAMLRNPAPPLRMEAARACGELELKAASPELIDLLEDSDSGVRRAAIWSLGQVGGKPAYLALQQILRRKEDSDEAELADQAIENLGFIEGSGQLLLYGRDDDLDDEAEEE